MKILGCNKHQICSTNGRGLFVVTESTTEWSQSIMICVLFRFICIGVL